MPSISQARLDEMEASLASTARLARLAKAHEDRASTAEQKLRQFDDILDKIIKAAMGRPLIENRDGYWPTPAFSYAADPRATDAEREAMAQEQLRERVITLESRLAAVVAVAQFAKGHKA